jgi:hypothetical protein
MPTVNASGPRSASGISPCNTRREHERTRSFRRMRNWRVGVEARIKHLKRGFGLPRTRLRHLDGAPDLGRPGHRPLKARFRSHPATVG